VTLTEPQLRAWGAAVGAAVRPPAFFALSGELGAGKSVLARAIAEGAGVDAAMPSPTFNLLFRYPTDRGTVVVHLDLYRLDRPEQVRELGWRELGADDEIVIVEWPERAERLLPAERWDVHLEHAGPDRRRVSVRPYGSLPPLPALPESAA
jgi:tRNA threonylcarbamoyladenosine biosynthesis protein TsaE